MQKIMRFVQLFTSIITAFFPCLPQMGYSIDVGDRIKGGSAVTQHLYPYFIRIFTRQNTTCGGTLVDSSKVITALHCVGSETTSNSWNFTWLDPNDFILTGGEITYNVTDEQNEVQKANVSQIVRASDVYSVDKDIAMLELTTPFATTQYVSPIRICTQDEEKDQSLGLKVVGMGVEATLPNGSFVEPQTLKVLDLVEESLDYCYQSMQIPSTVPISSNDSLICARALKDKSNSVCSGDSGGGLVKFDNADKPLCVLGVVSMGTICTTLNTELSSIFVRIRNFQSFFKLPGTNSGTTGGTTVAGNSLVVTTVNSTINPIVGTTVGINVNSSVGATVDTTGAITGNPTAGMTVKTTVNVTANAVVNATSAPGFVTRSIALPPLLPSDYGGASLIKLLHYQFLVTIFPLIGLLN